MSHRNIEILGLYLYLARASARRQRPHVRDRLLVIAASMAYQLELPSIAAYCRLLVLEHNRNHNIGKHATLHDAMESEDFLSLLKQLQRKYPLEKVETMVADLGIELANERDAYYTDEEYAAALLGESLESLQERIDAQ